MAEWCADRNCEDALHALRSKRIPCAAVNSLDQVMADPQVKARRLLQDVAIRGTKRGIKLAPAPVRLGAEPQPIGSGAPLLGEHTDDVLAELGYSPADIGELRAAGAI
jgi:crotonobetainyl-CoA:carnitine CoA-transferase CaiB-like acyl-CoA transferase